MGQRIGCVNLRIVMVNLKSILVLRIVTTRGHVVFQSWAVNKRFFRLDTHRWDLCQKAITESEEMAYNHESDILDSICLNV